MFICVITLPANVNQLQIQKSQQLFYYCLKVAKDSCPKPLHQIILNLFKSIEFSIYIPQFVSVFTFLVYTNRFRVE